MMAIRVLIFQILFTNWTFLLAVIALPLMFFPKKYTLPVGRVWAYVSLALLKLVLNIDYKLVGSENIPSTPCIIASKHQSAWETVAFHLIFNKPCFILKRELLFLPLFGLYLWRMDMIAIDRSSGANALKKMVKEAKKIKNTGRPIVIFPEGTRTSPGEKREYQPGVAALYDMLKIPVIPIRLDSGNYWGKKILDKKSGTISVEIMPAINPGLKRQEFMERLYSLIEE